jgi:hypothetical protein
MKTAVEWLEDCFNRYGAVLKSDFIKAKEMEKQQIIDSYSEGEFNCGMNESAEEYYEETFNK